MRLQSRISCVSQAIGLSAFLWVYSTFIAFRVWKDHSLLLIEYVAATAIDGSAERALERKNKTSLPLPVSLVIIFPCAQLMMPVQVLLLEISPYKGKLTPMRIKGLIWPSDAAIFFVYGKSMDYGLCSFPGCSAHVKCLVVRVAICDHPTRWVSNLIVFPSGKTHFI